MSATQQLLMSGGAAVNLLPHTISGLDNKVAASATATATYTLNLSGQAQATTFGNASTPPAGTLDYAGEWMNVPPSSAYESRVTMLGGTTLSSGSVDNWQLLSTTRSWTVTCTVGAGGGTVSKNAQFTIEVRDKTTLVVLDTETITLNSQANSS